MAKYLDMVEVSSEVISPQPAASIELLPQGVQFAGNGFRRACVIRRENSASGVPESQVWFEFDRCVPVPPDDDCDAYLLAVLMDAMREGRDIVVRGSVSQRLLSNLTEFQAVWRKWRPAEYRLVDIQADEIRPDATATRVPGAISAFSGGVDASFTVWRHSQRLCGARSFPLKACVFVHGFDIPLQDTEAYGRALAGARRTLSDLGLPLMPVATNFRTISKVPWEHVFAIALVAVMVNFRGIASTGLIGSSNPYDAMVTAWGSTPVADPLLGGGEFEVIHDGSSHNRCEKVAAIAAWPAGLSGLRVCWQGASKDRNCGRCEKCLRTKLNFLASGLEVPSSFEDVQVDSRDVRRVRIRSDALRADWGQILQHAQGLGLQAPWMEAVADVIRRRDRTVAIRRVADFVLPAGSARREWASGWAGRIARP